MSQEKKPSENKNHNDHNDKDVQENKAIAFLSYLSILCLIPLLAGKESKFAQFHSKQGLILFIVWILASWISGFIPIIGWFLLAPIVTITGLVLSIIGLLNVAHGETKELPIIGDIVKKFNI